MEQNPIPEPNDLPPMNGNLQTPPVTEPTNPPLSMKSKNNWLISIVFLVVGILIGVGGILAYQKYVAAKPVAVASPTPVATIDPTASWKTYTDPSGQFSLKYPSSVNLNAEAKNSTANTLSIQVTPVNKITDMPLGFDKATAIADIASLSKGEFGKSINFGIPESEKVFKVGDTYGKTFTTLQVLEVCDVRFTRTAIIYYKNYQIMMTYIGPKSLIEASPNYFTDSQAGCGAKIWKEGNTFYSDVASGKAPQAAQDWFDTFDQVLSTFKFFNATGSAAATPAAVACTLEAKICPDGSSVGRTGPNCEFAPCP